VFGVLVAVTPGSLFVPAQGRGQIPGLKLARSIANQRCADSCSEEVWIAPSCRSLGRWVSPMVLLGPSDDLIRGCSLAGRCLTQTLLDSIYCIHPATLSSRPPPSPHGMSSTVAHARRICTSFLLPRSSPTRRLANHVTIPRNRGVRRFKQPQDCVSQGGIRGLAPFAGG
jgi:hypothetical protein